MKLKKIISFDGTIDCLTGIAIRGMENDLGIGGADSEVTKNPLTGEPYLPGSSLKGKMRSQLERKYGARKAGRRDQPPFPPRRSPAAAARGAARSAPCSARISTRGPSPRPPASSSGTAP